MNEAPVIAYIFERYGVLSQTFLRREVAGLLRAGLRIEIYSMLTPSGHISCGVARPLTPTLSSGGGEGEALEGGTVPKIRSAEAEEFQVNCFRWWEVVKLFIAIPRELWRDPKLLRDGWRLWREYPPTSRENFLATVWALVFALCRAPQFRRNRPAMFHGVRATGPAMAAAILRRLCGVPFSFGGHSYDIYRHGGDAFLEPKMRAACFVHTTTEAAANYLRRRGGESAKIVLARRGLEKLPENKAQVGAGRGVRLLSVGRLVAKKGHAHQIAACAVLKARNIPFAARIVGEGPLREALQFRIEQAGLCDFVTLCGALPPEEVEAEYRCADIFWHTGIVDEQSDCDGLPNVIPEAFAHGLPVISCNLPGACEAVMHEQTGLVVKVTDAKQLADAVKRLADNPTLRKELGENGHRWVGENFLSSRNCEILAHAFRTSID